VAEWLERLPMTLKVPGLNHNLCAEFFIRYVMSRGYITVEGRRTFRVVPHSQR